MNIGDRVKLKNNSAFEGTIMAISSSRHPMGGQWQIEYKIRWGRNTDNYYYGYLDSEIVQMVISVPRSIEELFI